MEKLLDHIRNNPDIVQKIDWEMTPEDAVSRYLEWGSSWSHGKNMIRSKKDVSYYFTVSTWDDPPKVHLMRITMEDALDVASVEIPLEMKHRFLKTIPSTKGVYAINQEIREWLGTLIYGP